MIIRLVRMTFQADKVGAFLRLYDETSGEIRAFDGCLHLELWQDTNAINVLTTYSHWRDPDALEAYRQSELFRKTWTAVKVYFLDRPEAKSLAPIRP